jgi:ribosomal protein L11 methyltransferase
MHYTRASQKIFEVLVSVKSPAVGAREILKDIFINSGFAPQHIIEQTVDGRQALAVYCPTEKKADAFARRIGALKLPGLNSSVTALYQDDWLTRWKKDWKPFRLTASIDVVPVWCRQQYKAGRRKFILLDTVSSFGTGLHETTRFMAEFIEELNGKFGRFLDVGTGTGILALVALKGEVDDVTAIDMDDMCIDASKANFKANGYDHGGRIFHKDLTKFDPLSPFDFVCANLVTHDLIQMKREILSFVKPGGWLAVSGISLENLPRLRAAFARLPLRCVRVKKGKNWSAVLFKRSG